GILSFTPLGRLVRDRAGTAPRQPVVVVGEYDDDMHAIGALADGRGAGEIVGYLADLGHRRFLHVAGPPDWASARNRRDAYLDAIARRGLESADVIHGDWTMRSGYEAAARLREEPGVTAVFAANDYMAMGVIRGLQDRGVRVPEDVSVFGWDDEQFAEFLSPSMSTVRVDREAQGRQAMLSLLALVRGEPAPRTEEGL
ncbi:substrate-binding domain-containing protein, partial [Streptosporangium fragile]|uniref:substrate-binding domain-containing protein n=1 Tax=Streptosporangium fragile TaxID=46186 RepID=UPI0031E5A68E